MKLKSTLGIIGTALLVTFFPHLSSQERRDGIWDHTHDTSFERT